MNAKTIPLAAATRLSSTIDAGLYFHLLALAEKLHEQAPDVAEELIEELERADLRPPDEMPDDVVTSSSTVTFRDSATQVSDERLTVLAHELRTPLSALSNAAELLARSAAREPAIARISEIVSRQTTTIRTLVEQLLDVNRLDTERVRLRMCDVDLRAVVANAVEDHRAQIEKAGLRFELLLIRSRSW